MYIVLMNSETIGMGETIDLAVFDAEKHIDNTGDEKHEYNEVHSVAQARITNMRGIYAIINVDNIA